MTVDGISKTVGAGDPVVTVQAWHFVRFSSPVANGGVANTVKAGQTVPLKWQLLDAAGKSVTTLTNATIKVKTLACALGSTPDLPVENSPGASGFKNLGKGNYELDWKTPSSYARSCKTLKLDIGDGVTHNALFSITK